MAKKKMSVEVAKILAQRISTQLINQREEEFKKNGEKIKNSKEFKQLESLHKKYSEAYDKFLETKDEFEKKTRTQIYTGSKVLSLESSGRYHNGTRLYLEDIKNEILLQDFASNGEFNVDEFVNKMVKQYTK